MTQYAIIVAGGSGSRMKAEVPKQFLLLNGKPILQHTLERFMAFSPLLRVVLVLPGGKPTEAWHQLCETHDFYPPIDTVAGGATRFQSVRNGLARVRTEAGLVAVHDGVRPMVTPTLIGRGFETAAEAGTAIAAVALNDSVRQRQPDGSTRAVDRSQFSLIQTPQTFRLDWMRDAFARPEQPHYTDCASVLEAAGYPITLIEGDYSNLKITTPADLQYAAGLI
jgi:2-C-methyl-D-erythritol 4-phosphate cytidylyltransferase